MGRTLVARASLVSIGLLLALLTQTDDRLRAAGASANQGHLRAESASVAQAPAAQAGSRAERTAWYFYRVKWGFQDEFVDLFQKNHYPVLKEQIKTGRVTAVRTYVPTYHGDGRADWTFAVAITFKDTAAMTGPSGEDEIVRRLYKDLATFRKEEQRRFEILDAHWDVALNELDLDARKPSR